MRLRGRQIVFWEVRIYPWSGTNGLWADLTTASQWAKHERQYGAGSGIPLIYECGQGFTNAWKLDVGLGVGIAANKLMK
ncbi:hypothetical protein CWO84_02200 [Methylomonas sp. Kb3]|nr:hypothetical protein CWO84_02200 [Methylomonas sp. Kb3]